MITSTPNRATIGSVLALAFLLAAIASLMLAAEPSYASTTYYVNSTADHADPIRGDGCDTGYTVTRPGGGQEAECTLRAAISEANHTDTSPGADTINFAIPGSDVKTIAPETALPAITEAVSINGYTQPGASPNTKAVGSDAVLKIELNAAGVPDGDGLFIAASNSTVRGLVINRARNSGILIGPGTTGNKVVGNFIGTDATGTQKLGNNYGIHVYDGSNNTIGGTTAGERNVISGNERIGVVVYGGGATGNRILSNSIFSNGLLGIDLKDDGPTANDTGDTDTGPNGLQNKPVLSSAKKGATGTTTVKGNLNSTPGKTFQLQFYSNPEGTDEGKTLLGSKSVTTDGTGNVTLTFSTTKAIRLGQNITATATNASTGDTSEFSAPRKVVAQ